MGTVAAGGAAAAALRARQEASRTAAQRAATEERLRMAQDLHDGVGHGLAVIAMQAGVALHVLDEDPRQGAPEPRGDPRAPARSRSTRCAAELARMSGEPGARRPAPGLGRPRRPARPGPRRRAGGRPHGTVDGDCPSRSSRTAYAVVQEALTNVLRHAQATRASRHIRATGRRLVVTVARRRRRGGATGQDGGMGISGMRDAVEALGRLAEAGPRPSGFRVRADPAA